MKKLFYAFACVLVSFAMASCTPKEEASAEQTLVGSWITTKYDWKKIKNGNVVSSGTEYFDENYYMLWTYRADGTFVDMTVEEEDDAYQYVGTWVATSDKLYMNYKGEAYNQKYEWSDVYNISKLSASTLVLKFTEIEIESDGTKWEDVTEYTFTKKK